jgi:hypothetical protein
VADHGLLQRREAGPRTWPRAARNFLTPSSTFVRHVFGLDPIAAARGATLVPAFGYDYVPGNLAGALALTRGASGHAASRRLLPHPTRAR